MQLITLAQSPASSRALQQALQPVQAGQSPYAQGSPLTVNHRLCIFEPLQDASAVCTEFERLSAELMTALAAVPTASEQATLVIVDYIQPDKLCAWSDSANWEDLVAALILAFPDVAWHFALVGQPAHSPGRTDQRPRFPGSAGLAPSAAPPRDPVYDGTGLREFIKRARPRSTSAGFEPIPSQRTERAAAIDDEPSMAHFHAYCAYRVGYRAEAVTSMRSMRELFGSENTAEDAFALSLEDMHLGFPDKLAHESLSDLAQRRALFPGLPAPASRRLVTAGRIAGRTAELIEANTAYLGRPAIFKPTGDMLALASEAGLVTPTPRSYLTTASQGNDEGGQALPRGHSAHGRLLMVSWLLIRRAEALLNDARNVRTALRGAVLATEALELTAGKSPAVSLEALSLKHQLEVMSECFLMGAGYHATAQPRINEIQRDCDCIAEWFDQSKRQAASLNAQMKIANALLRIYRANGQYEEEVAYSHWTSRLEFHLRGGRSSLSHIKSWPSRYLLAASRDLPTLLCYMGGWIFVLMLLFAWASTDEKTIWFFEPRWEQAVNLTWSYLGCGLSDAISSFFSIGAPFRPTGADLCRKTDEMGPAYALFVNLAIMLGVLHIGMLIAMLVSRLNRK